MKERMRKLTLLLYHREKDDFLDKLRDLGVVHVEEKPEVSSAELARTRTELRRVEHALGELQKAAKQKQVDRAASREKPVDEILAEYERLAGGKESAEQSAASLRKEIAALEPWGDFDPESLRKLADVGIHLRFFEVQSRKYAQLDLTKVEHELISAERGKVRFLVVEREEPVEIDAEEAVFPWTSLSRAKQKLAQTDQELQKNAEQMAELSAYAETLARHAAQLRGNESYESVRLSMEKGADGRLVSVTGWVPGPLEQRVREFVEQYSAWYSFDDPGKGDVVPIVLRNGPFSRLFEPITRLFQLPNYFEIDPTVAIAPFFAIFFGNCLGDAGYGVVITVLTLLAASKLAGNGRRLALLGTVLGIATTIMGLLNSGTIFGMTVSENTNIPGFDLLADLVVIDQDAAIKPFNFALMLGLVQMTVGMLLNIYNNIRYASLAHAMPGIGRILIVLSGVVLFLVVSQDVEVLRPLLVYAVVGMVAGVASLMFVAYFTRIEEYLPVADAEKATGVKKLFLVVLIRTVNFVLKLYFVVSGAVGDILSYIRLFALGLSSGILGFVVNAIALDLRGLEIAGVPVGLVLFIPFLIVGHVGNLALAGLSSFVHPLRLTFVEFYNNLVFTGGGIEYRPFRKPSEGSDV